ncbi:metal-sulfur cluster assembly factor [Companilactobacillus hulinensis]|uniref:metal-sulfur cluster assembly factor n=1 Tax=Companilactobacillus hulinensis TaxID=2486007 RepID=UPI000F786F3D|nr:metal-sulfur cluster assembly factor [Companilactobacillus hulinensis]
MMNNEKIEDQVMSALTDVIDPELGIDIVNLGLIYEIGIIESDCKITMTLTTMGCPLGNLLADQIERAAKSVDGVDDVEINLVWEPVWNVGMVSRFARTALGIYG